jgi:FkbM family methyltransferase
MPSGAAGERGPNLSRMAATVEHLSPSRQELDADRVVDVETDVGPLWVERDAEILTPTLIKSGHWQQDVIALMSAVLRPGMTVVDAGANIGYVSVRASKLVGPTGKVFCIEADPGNVPILQANLWRNGCTNATVLPVAAWSERTELNLTVYPEGGGACTHVSAGPVGDFAVPAYRLDELIDERVDYLKIDCEGTDHIVLSGATGLFRANPRLIATVEFAPDRDSHTGDTAHEILGTYERLGLRPYLITPTGRLRRGTYAGLESSGSPGELVVLDFALARRRPARQLLGHYLVDVPRHGLARLLRFGGDLLEYVPERIRPPIRGRDRRPPGG